ncbi:unnamed protein product [Paramecium pentaurelia]|uniref:PPM-type phosphatase domain-containing protein n=1 Tax=Paramecium pentaurelia TaxID=43138 RepID=A0A8S1WFW8_9CILI|nr:unnamed protein product [Paramecium pentaurelia]
MNYLLICIYFSKQFMLCHFWRSIFIFIEQVRDSNKWKIVELSNDHNPDIPSEKKRIISQQRMSQSFGTENARVWLMLQNISWQALSRLIECCWGYIIDQQKNTHKQFFEQEYNPELIYYKLNQKCWFLVIASNGVQIICRFCCSQMNENKIDEIVENIVKESTRRLQEEDEIANDISLIIVYFS